MVKEFIPDGLDLRIPKKMIRFQILLLTLCLKCVICVNILTPLYMCGILKARAYKYFMHKYVVMYIFWVGGHL